MELVVALALVLAVALVAVRVRAQRRAQEMGRRLVYWSQMVSGLEKELARQQTEMALVKAELQESLSQLDSLLEKESVPHLAMDSTQEQVMGLRLVQVQESDLARESGLAQGLVQDLNLAQESELHLVQDLAQETAWVSGSALVEQEPPQLD